MYNLAKLLTDEPEKLERLVILFLKLLITFLAAVILLGFDLSISSIIKDPIPETYSASRLLYFFACFILLWFFLWFIIEGAFYDLPVLIFSKGANTRASVMKMLSIVGVVNMPNYDLRKKIPKLIHPGKHIKIFVEALKAQNEERFIEKNTSRLKQYYVLIVASFILLLASKDVDLSCCQRIGVSLIILLLLIGCIVFRQLQRYINDNYDALLREFEPMVYSHMVHQTIKEETFIEQNYNIPEDSWGKQVVNLKKDSYLPFPKQIKIIPAYHWNESFVQQLMEITMAKRKSKNKPIDYPCIDLYISNVKPTDVVCSLIASQNAIVFIHATNEQEIFDGLEEAFYKLQRIYYGLKKKASDESPEKE